MRTTTVKTFGIIGAAWATKHSEMPAIRRTSQDRENERGLGGWVDPHSFGRLKRALVERAD